MEIGRRFELQQARRRIERVCGGVGMPAGEEAVVAVDGRRALAALLVQVAEVEQCGRMAGCERERCAQFGFRFVVTVQMVGQDSRAVEMGDLGLPDPAAKGGCIGAQGLFEVTQAAQGIAQVEPCVGVVRARRQNAAIGACRLFPASSSQKLVRVVRRASGIVVWQA